MKRRILSIILTLSMILSMLPITVWAAGIEPDDGLCPHHTEHTEECGYIPASKGAPCAHEHTDNCYTAVTSCVHVHDDGCYSIAADTEPIALEDQESVEDAGADTCGHVCTGESGCVTLALECVHVHDEACGYSEPVEGVPCEYVCDICNGAAEVQALIDALPTVGEVRAMDTDGQRTAYDQVQDAYGAYQALTDEQRGLITGAEVFEALFAFFNGRTMPLEDSAFGGGSGTSASPYQISTRDHLAQLATDVNSGNSYSGKYFKLMNDINLGGNNSPWTPIGSSNSTGFDGTFDGGNQTVSGLYINSTSNYQGLFGYITSSGVIQNLGVDGSVTGSQRIGGIVGLNRGTITNCSNTGSITGSDGYAGGIAGQNNGTITNCSNTGSITSNGELYVGGIAGLNRGTITSCSNSGSITGIGYVSGIAAYNSGTITSCSNSGSITGSGGYVGGIAGYNNGTITNCSNTGSIAGSGSYVGGVAGINYGSSIVEKCYNTGNVQSGSTYAGGVVGYNYGTDDGSSVPQTLNCYNTGRVSVASERVGGVTGFAANNAVVRYCYSIGTVEVTNAIGADSTVSRGGVAGYNYRSTVEYCYYLQGCGASNGVGSTNGGTNTVWNNTADDFKSLAATLNSNGNSNVWTDSPTLGHPVLIDNREDRIPFGGEIPEENATIEATYGQTKTQTFNLDNYIQYEDNSHASGNFTYTVSTLPSGITAQVNGSQLTVTLSNTVNVGTYTLTIIAHEDNPKIATVAITDFDKIDVVLTVKVRINKAPATATVTGQTLTYNGSAQNLVTGSTSDGTLSYSLEQNSTFGSIPTATNAGSYTVYYKVVGDSNHTDISGSVTATINPKTVSSPTVTVTPASYTYTGSPIIPQTVEVKDDGTIIPSSEYTLSYSNNTDVGNATVTVTDRSDGNYTVSGTGTFEITKADSTVMPSINQTVTYGETLTLTAEVRIAMAAANDNNIEFFLNGESLGSAPVSTTGGGTATLDVVASSTKGFVIGTNTITARYNGGVNLNGSNGSTITVTVNQKELIITDVTAAEREYQPGNSIVTVLGGTLVGVVGSEDVHLDNSNATGAMNDADAGTGKSVVVTGYTLTGDDVSHYTLKQPEGVTVNINKATPEVTPPTAIPNLKYTGQPQALITAGTTTGGELQYSLDNSSYFTNIPEGTAAKNYTVYYKVVGGNNYEDVAAGDPISVAIAEAEQPAPEVTINYTAETLSTTADIEYSLDGNALWTACTAAMSITAFGWNGTADVTVYFRYHAKEGHAASEMKPLTIPARPVAPTGIKVTKAQTSVTLTCAAAEFAENTPTSWQGGTFNNLTAGETYTFYVRIKATATAFASPSAEVTVTTVMEDGSTTLKPGETVETGNGGTITNNGDNITLEDGNGNTTTVTPPEGKDFNGGVEVDGDGNVTVPDGSTVTPPGGPDITVGPGNGGTVDEDGNITLPGGGSAQIGDTTVTVPEDGGTLKPDGKGGVEVPGGSTVTRPVARILQWVSRAALWTKMAI